MPEVFDLETGSSPLILSFPHDGTELPADLGERLTDHARSLPDTDWLVRALYEPIVPAGATIVSARYSRYVVDLNRGTGGGRLYPGQFETTVCPTLTFSGNPVYNDGCEPTTPEVEDRIVDYWKPYHDCLRAQIHRVRDIHGYALLWDAHSIASEVPGLFDGVLPDLNIGTNSGQSCDGALAAGIEEACRRQSEFSFVFNARFKGGHITREYGDPENNVHAVQLEIGQATYLSDSDLPELDGIRADTLRGVIRQLLDAFVKSGVRRAAHRPDQGSEVQLNSSLTSSEVQ